MPRLNQTGRNSLTAIFIGDSDVIVKLTLDEIRALVHEELLRGVPDFAVREATRKYVCELKQHIIRHISMTRGSTIATREAMGAMNETLKEFENEVNDLVEEKLWKFMMKC